MAESFGYKIAWLAVKANEPDELIAKLDPHNFDPIGWDHGINASYEQHALFVSPAINGWVFLVGDTDTILEVFYQSHRVPPNDQLDLNPLLYYGMAGMSAYFPEVQCYMSHRVGGLYSYAKAVNGDIARAYHLDLTIGRYFEIGKPSPMEVKIGATFLPELAPRDQDESITGEDLVDFMAGFWSINPHDFSKPEWDWLSGEFGLIYTGETSYQRYEIEQKKRVQEILNKVK